ncbi:hypothetical protein JT358_10560 [Micrococcales bacterium 31B]|nr:hypothetical protein [Micrococcales bacterium 31B]
MRVHQQARGIGAARAFAFALLTAVISSLGACSTSWLTEPRVTAADPAGGHQPPSASAPLAVTPAPPRERDRNSELPDLVGTATYHDSLGQAAAPDGEALAADFSAATLARIVVESDPSLGVHLRATSLVSVGETFQLPSRSSGSTWRFLWRCASEDDIDLTQLSFVVDPPRRPPTSIPAVTLPSTCSASDGWRSVTVPSSMLDHVESAQLHAYGGTATFVYALFEVPDLAAPSADERQAAELVRADRAASARGVEASVLRSTREAFTTGALLKYLSSYRNVAPGDVVAVGGALSGDSVTLPPPAAGAAVYGLYALCDADAGSIPPRGLVQIAVRVAEAPHDVLALPPCGSGPYDMQPALLPADRTTVQFVSLDAVPVSVLYVVVTNPLNAEPE